MSKGSAIIAILIAFVGGIAIGHLTGTSSSSGDETAAVQPDAAAPPGAAEAAGSDIERFKVPVTTDRPEKGAKDALVTIVEFSDFQCPFCGRVEPTVSRIMNDYKGKVRFIWRNNPLPFHEHAMPAAIAAMEAYAQGGDAKFWQYHDLLYSHQQAETRADLEKYAQQVGLDMNKFKAALDHNAHQDLIKADQQLAAKFGARGTPGFFVDGRLIMGAQPYDKFKTVIDDEIGRAQHMIGAGVAKANLYTEFTRNAKTEAAPPTPPSQQNNQPHQMPDPNAVYKVPVGHSPVRGPNDALVTIVEFSDFQCPFCGRAEPTLKQIRDTYGHDVRIVWKNNPLPFHQNAMPSAELSMEAFAEGSNAKFWQVHDLLYQNQQAETRPDLEKYAQQAHLNMTKVKAALDNDTHKADIQADQALARQLGASGTPYFFINGRQIRGAQPFEAFKTVIDQELAKAKALVAHGTPRAKVYEETVKNGATSPQMINAPGANNAPSHPAAPPADQHYNIPVPPHSPERGNPHAKVVIQEFSDFQCPFCGRVEPTVKQIMSTYGNRVRFIWRNYPLPFHQNAMPCAQAAMEVYRQGGNAKFWQFHDLLFSNQQAETRADLEKYAQQIGGINMTQFRAALDGSTHTAEIQADQHTISQAGAQIGTPSFFINGTLVQGAQPFEAFKAAIDKALAAAH